MEIQSLCDALALTPRLRRSGYIFRQRFGEGIYPPVGLLNRAFASMIIPQHGDNRHNFPTICG